MKSRPVSRLKKKANWKAYTKHTTYCVFTFVQMLSFHFWEVKILTTFASRDSLRPVSQPTQRHQNLSSFEEILSHTIPFKCNKSKRKRKQTRKLKSFCHLTKKLNTRYKIYSTERDVQRKGKKNRASERHIQDLTNNFNTSRLWSSAAAHQ